MLTGRKLAREVRAEENDPGHGVPMTGVTAWP